MRRVLFFLLFLFLPALALAQTSPTDFLRVNVNAVTAILASPAYKNETTRPKERQRIEAIVNNFFDAQELSKRSLARYWRLFNEAQRREFQGLFLKLIEQAYLKKSLAYNNEVVTFDQEIIKSDTLAEVHTTLLSASKNIPINYLLIKHGDSWLVYDVSVENVSLAKNYYSQFQSILQTKSPDELIALLRKKTNE